ncbi:hypothetical protein ABL78_6875 [Leptomonas seymouri]|uniref:Uncharacterized protein n=1 Tax=Leptomonas seymouri TaxID=5684 RepID=A0A0N1I2R4_LEPSE|nr:hypothetical protein ABL78_6875 [Leptomonas seymouri]|eukprot:KPI84072.1 hypothetical protein ABL78_6875 [Leptomonas seymouri]
MKFRVIGGPLTSSVNVEAKHSDTFKSIFEKLESAAGKSTSLDEYDLFTSTESETAGHYTPAAGPLRSSDTPESLQLDDKQEGAHVLLLVLRGESHQGRNMTLSLSHSNSACFGEGDLGSWDTASSLSMSSMPTPRATEGYQRRILAMFLKYDPGNVAKTDVALKRYAGSEEDVIQLLVKKYGPEPAANEVDTSPAAVTRALAAAEDRGTHSGTAPTEVSVRTQQSPVASYRDRLFAIYSTYKPEKLSKVDGTLRRFAGREEAVIQQLVKKYGPEPPVHAVPADHTSTPITVSEAPATRSSGWTPMANSTAPTATNSPRNSQGDYGSNSAFLLASPSAPVDAAPITVRLPLTYRDRLTAMYATYDPSKICLVDGTLKRYSGREEAVLKQLVKVYGPEPSPEKVAAAKEAAMSLARTRRASGDVAAAAGADTGSSTLPRVEEPCSATPETTPPRIAAEMLSAVSRTVEDDGATATAARTGPIGAEESPAVGTATAATPVPVVVEVTASTPVESVPGSPSLLPFTEALINSESAEKLSTSGLGVEDVRQAANEKSEAGEVNGRYRERLVALYHTYNPSKLHTVEGTLKKFSGKEEGAIQQLVRRYGPEPPALTTEEAYELLQSASGSSPMSSPRTLNANARAIPALVPESTSSSHRSSSKPASPADKAVGEYEGYRARICAILAAHDPDKLGIVDAIMARYKGKEEVIAKLEQRYGISSGGAADVRVGSASPEMRAVVSPVPSVDEVAVSATASSRARTVVSDNDATRTTAPPSRRSSYSDSDHEDSAPALLEGEKEEAQPVKELTAATTRATKSSPPAPAPLQRSLQLQPLQQPHRPAPRTERLIAVTQVAASHFAMLAQKAVLQRYWSSWCQHHVNVKVKALLRDELWVVAPPPSSLPTNGQADTADSGYRLNDAVQPPYMVADLSTVVAQEEQRAPSKSAVFSSEMEIAARNLLSSLRHCVESRIVEVRSDEEKELANRFLAHWRTAGHLCPVRDSSEFALALHQAAHLIAQLDDLMTVIRTQAGQLQQLKNLHKDVVQRMETAQSDARCLERLQTQLATANARRRELEEELKRVSSRTAIPARSPSGAGRRPGDSGRASPPARPAYRTMEERKDAQIAKLQQELAKTRNALFASKVAEEEMRLQVQQSISREARREREARRREGPPGHHSRPLCFSPLTRSHSGPAGQHRRSTPGSPSRQRGYPAATTPRGAFSQAIALSTPRRPSESVVRVEHNGLAMSSIRKPHLDVQDRSNISVNSNSPWPTSRFVMTAEIERGPCPNCLTPLTSCSGETNGPASAKAAFCFSCRRSFTFRELSEHGARDTLDHL